MSEERRVYFLRVALQGRLNGRDSLIAQFIGGPISSLPERPWLEMASRACCGRESLGSASKRPTAPYYEGEELIAAVRLDFDMDCFAIGAGSRMERLKALWVQALEREAGTRFIEDEAGNPLVEAAAQGWGRLIALHESAQLGEAAGEGQGKRPAPGLRM